MKKFFKIFTLLLMTMMITSTSFAEPIPLRGIVEGFYGRNWMAAEREDMMNFCRENKLNAYIYAPKDDPYHRDKWREPYPSEKISELKNLVQAAKTNGVKFIFAVSPGLDLHYKGKNSDTDYDFLMQKFEAMYNIGVRDFAIFFDDLKDEKGNHHENGKDQAEFINKIQTDLRNNHKDIGQILTVPTEYFLEDMLKRGKVKDYTEDFSKYLDKKVVILFTGEGVVCDGISAETLAEANKIFDRQVGIWWNYPVNDYSVTADGERNAKLALGAVEKLPAGNVQAIFFNPMSQAQMSKISLATGAEYANNPANYKPEVALDKAIKTQYGDLAEAMKVFADHSQHMENSWAKCGPADSRNFSTQAYLVLYNFKKSKQNVDYSGLNAEIDLMEKSSKTLLEKLPEKILSECRAQLEQFGRIAQADKLAVQSLQAKKIDAKLLSLREEIKSHEKTAILSEQSALKFVDDVIALLK